MQIFCWNIFEWHLIDDWADWADWYDLQVIYCILYKFMQILCKLSVELFFILFLNWWLNWLIWFTGNFIAFYANFIQIYANFIQIIQIFCWNIFEWHLIDDWTDWYDLLVISLRFMQIYPIMQIFCWNIFEWHFIDDWTNWYDLQVISLHFMQIVYKFMQIVYKIMQIVCKFSVEIFLNDISLMIELIDMICRCGNVAKGSAREWPPWRWTQPLRVPWPPPRPHRRRRPTRPTAPIATVPRGRTTTPRGALPTATEATPTRARTQRRPCAIDTRRTAISDTSTSRWVRAPIPAVRHRESLRVPTVWDRAIWCHWAQPIHRFRRRAFRNWAEAETWTQWRRRLVATGRPWDRRAEAKSTVSRTNDCIRRYPISRRKRRPISCSNWLKRCCWKLVATAARRSLRSPSIPRRIRADPSGPFRCALSRSDSTHWDCTTVSVPSGSAAPILLTYPGLLVHSIDFSVP